jgi:adenine-specific DNA-methyltransferase
MSTLLNQYSELSVNITNKLSKDEKKEFGIFITPKIIINKLYISILKFSTIVKRILEPSCGTCEIVKYCDTIYDKIEIDGIEYNKTIFNSIKDLKFNNNVRIIECDFMKYETDKKYDLIIGNPPYFVCKKPDIPNKYHKFCVGRPNIFGLFIIHSLSMLNNGGILAFIIPKSFLNSLYYAVVRNYIKNTCTILEIIDFKENNEFIDTDQATFGLILRKLDKEIIGEECSYSIKINGNFIFATDLNLLKKLFEGTTTLVKMGLNVRTGNIVWNQHKKELTSDPQETLLIYNTNIAKNNKIELRDFEAITNKRKENSDKKKKKKKTTKEVSEEEEEEKGKPEEKRQYIKTKGRMEPTLIVNRGNGNSAYKLNYCIVENGPYLIENHLNEIYSEKEIKKEDLISMYEKIMNSFRNPKTQQFIEMFLGNNGLSKTELESIFPIYE